MKELLEALENTTNVSSIQYDTLSKLWRVEFYEGETQHMESDILIDFLNNA